MTDKVINAVVLLPEDIRRFIVSFVSRSKTAEIIRNSFSCLDPGVDLKYVRVYKFTENTYNKYNVWNDLKPTTLESIYYGDKNVVRRVCISKGESLRLSQLGIMPSGIRFW